MSNGMFLDLETWPRRDHFHYFRGFEYPFFQVCASVTVGPTWDHCRAQGIPFSLACWFLIGRAANQIEPFRYRVRPEGVWVHEQIGVSTLAIRPDESFAVCRLPRDEQFADFLPAAKAAMQATQQAKLDIHPDNADDVLHGSTLPWIRFTSITHAREKSSTDSVPKVVIGKVDSDHRGTLTMPVAVDAHHALLDGVHIARFLERLDALFASPAEQLALAT